MYVPLSIGNFRRICCVSRGDQHGPRQGSCSHRMARSVSRNFIQVAAPLTALTSIRSHFTWSEVAQNAFDHLKKLFTSAPILITPDPTRQFIVEVDASDVGVGAILSQCSSQDDKVHPCAFFSHCLTPAERNYDVGNRELLAIRLALGEWRHWLEGASVPFIHPSTSCP